MCLFFLFKHSPPHFPHFSCQKSNIAFFFSAGIGGWGGGGHGGHTTKPRNQAPAHCHVSHEADVLWGCFICNLHKILSDWSQMKSSSFHPLMLTHGSAGDVFFFLLHNALIKLFIFKLRHFKYSLIPEVLPSPPKPKRSHLLPLINPVLKGPFTKLPINHPSLTSGATQPRHCNGFIYLWHRPPLRHCGDDFNFTSRDHSVSGYIHTYVGISTNGAFSVQFGLSPTRKKSFRSLRKSSKHESIWKTLPSC